MLTSIPPVHVAHRDERRNGQKRACKRRSLSVHVPLSQPYLASTVQKSQSFFTSGGKNQILVASCVNGTSTSGTTYAATITDMTMPF